MSSLNENVKDVIQQISNIHSNCQNDINELVEKHISNKNNPLSNIDGGTGLVEELDQLIDEANRNVITLINSTINHLMTVAGSKGDNKLNNLLSSLLIVQSKAVTANKINATSTKSKSQEKQIERRYMWQFYQKVVEAECEFGRELADRSISELTESEELLKSIFDDLEEIAECAIRLKDKAGVLDNYLYEKIDAMDIYQNPNELRDDYIIAKANADNDLLFKKDGDNKYVMKYDIFLDPGNIDKASRDLLEVIQLNAKLRMDKGNEGGIKNARNELWEDIDNQTLQAYETLKHIMDEKTFNPTLAKNLAAYCESLKYTKAVSKDSNIIKNINDFKKCEEFSRKSFNQIDDMNLIEDEKAKVEELLSERIRFIQNIRKNNYNIGGEYMARYNEQSDKLTRAAAKYAECIENSKVSYRAFKEIQRERDNTLKKVLDLFATDFANKIIGKEEFLKQIGGFKAIKEDMQKHSRLGKDKVKKNFKLDDILTINDTDLSPLARIYKNYISLINTKKKLIELNNLYKNKPKFSDEDLENILVNFAIGQGSFNRLVDETSKFNDFQLPASVNKIKDGVAFFNFAFNAIIDDHNLAIKTKEIHNSIVDKLPAETVDYNRIVEEDTIDNNKKNRTLAKAKTKDLVKGRTSKINRH